MARKLDRDRPFAQIIPAQDGAHFEQDYKFFDQHGRQIVKPGSVPAREDDDPKPSGGARDATGEGEKQEPGPQTAQPTPPGVSDPASSNAEQDPEGDEPPPIVDAYPELGPIDPSMPWVDFRETILTRFGVRISNKQEGLTILDKAGLAP